MISENPMRNKILHRTRVYSLREMPTSLAWIGNYLRSTVSKRRMSPLPRHGPATKHTYTHTTPRETLHTRGQANRRRASERGSENRTEPNRARPSATKRPRHAHEPSRARTYLPLLPLSTSLYLSLLLPHAAACWLLILSHPTVRPVTNDMRGRGHRLGEGGGGGRHPTPPDEVKQFWIGGGEKRLGGGAALLHRRTAEGFGITA